MKMYYDNIKKNQYKKKKIGILFFYFQYMYVHLCSSALKFKTRRLHVCHLRYLFSYLKKVDTYKN